MRISEAILFCSVDSFKLLLLYFVYMFSAITHFSILKIIINNNNIVIVAHIVKVSLEMYTKNWGKGNSHQCKILLLLAQTRIGLSIS